MNYGEVTFSARIATQDSTDAGPEPDFLPVEGYVDFVPSRVVTYDDGTGSVLIIGKITAGIDENGVLRDGEGNASVTLIAADSPELSHQGWNWEARFRLNGVEVGPYVFPLNGGDVVNLGANATVNFSNGVAIIRGPKGDPGEPGPAGPAGPAGVNGTGAVDSVNGQVGTVLLNASHVGAQPAGDYVTNPALTGALSAYARKDSLAPVATSGDYNSLTGLPDVITSAGLPDDVRAILDETLVQGTNVSITPVGTTRVISATGGTGGTVSDASTTAKGVVQLAGDLGGTAAAPTVPTKVSRVFTKRSISGAYTLVADDALDRVLHVTSGSAVTITLPEDSAVSISQEITIPWRQHGAGVITFAAGTGATVVGRGGALKSAGQYAEGTVTKVAANTWVVSGDTTT